MKITSRSVTRTWAGKTILFAGDFRQVLPVMPRSSRAEIVAHSIKNHYALREGSVNVKRLRGNMRAAGDEEFAAYLLRIGDGLEPVEPLVAPSAVRLPESIAAPSGWTQKELLNHVFPNLAERALQCARSDASSVDTDFFKRRAVLTPKNSVVDELNEAALDEMVAQVKCKLREHLFSDSINSKMFAWGPIKMARRQAVLNRCRPDCKYLPIVVSHIANSSEPWVCRGETDAN